MPKYCDNPECRGGIGPHMTDECPWIKCGGMKLSVKSVLNITQTNQMRRITAARLELGAALDAHEHVVIKQRESAKCVICDEDFGWWCPASPDHVCHYHSDEIGGGGSVFLMYGCRHHLNHPADYSYKSESEDQCIFCGKPEERK